MNHARWTVPLFQSPSVSFHSSWMSVCGCVSTIVDKCNSKKKTSIMLDGFSAENYRNTYTTATACTFRALNIKYHLPSIVFSVALMEFLCFVMAKIRVYWMSEPVQLLLYTHTQTYCTICHSIIFIHKLFHASSSSRCSVQFSSLRWKPRQKKKENKQNHVVQSEENTSIHIGEFRVWFSKAVEMFKFRSHISNRLHVFVVLFLFMIIIIFYFSHFQCDWNRIEIVCSFFFLCDRKLFVGIPIC